MGSVTGLVAYGVEDFVELAPAGPIGQLTGGGDMGAGWASVVRHGARRSGEEARDGASSGERRGEPVAVVGDAGRLGRKRRRKGQPARAPRSVTPGQPLADIVRKGERRVDDHVPRPDGNDRGQGVGHGSRRRHEQVRPPDRGQGPRPAVGADEVEAGVDPVEHRRVTHHDDHRRGAGSQRRVEGVTGLDHPHGPVAGRVGTGGRRHRASMQRGGKLVGVVVGRPARSQRVRR